MGTHQKLDQILNQIWWIWNQKWLVLNLELIKYFIPFHLVAHLIRVWFNVNHTFAECTCASHIIYKILHTQRNRLQLDVCTFCKLYGHTIGWINIQKLSAEIYTTSTQVIVGWKRKRSKSKVMLELYKQHDAVYSL